MVDKLAGRDLHYSRAEPGRASQLPAIQLTELIGADSRLSRDQITVLTGFMRLGILDQLCTAHYASLEGKDSGNRSMSEIMKKTAVKRVIELDAKERESQGIRVIVCGPLDDKGKLIIRPVTTYPVYIIFPFQNGQRFLGISRLALSNMFTQPGWNISEDALGKVDILVAACAELYPENEIEGYNRLCQEVKMTDSFIKGEKSFSTVEVRPFQGNRVKIKDAVSSVSRTPEEDKLNRLKHWKILECLVRANDLMEQFPGLVPLYTYEQRAFDTLHGILRIQQIQTQSIIARLENLVNAPPVIRFADSLSTTINILEIRAGRDRYSVGNLPTGDAAPFEYGIAAILHL